MHLIKNMKTPVKLVDMTTICVKVRESVYIKKKKQTGNHKQTCVKISTLTEPSKYR
jgi:hypothetical protein